MRREVRKPALKTRVRAVMAGLVQPAEFAVPAGIGPVRASGQMPPKDAVAVSTEASEPVSADSTLANCV
jgi:hypothetical protein